MKQENLENKIKWLWRIPKNLKVKDTVHKTNKPKLFDIFIKSIFYVGKM